MIYELLKHESNGPVSLLFSKGMSEDIDMGEWRTSDKNLLSLGASTCIILAAHNGQTLYGLMGHFSGVSDSEEVPFGNREAFDATLAEVVKLGDPAHTSIFLGGGTPHEMNGTDSVETDRIYAEDSVMQFARNFKLPASQVLIEWSEPERAIDVELDCATGILAVHNAPEASVGVIFADSGE